MFMTMNFFRLVILVNSVLLIILCGSYYFFDFEKFFACGDETVVAASTQTPRIHYPVGVLTVVSPAWSAVDVVAIATHTFGVVFLFRVRAVKYLVDLFNLENFVKGFFVKIEHCLVNHWVCLPKTPPIISVTSLSDLWLRNLL